MARRNKILIIIIIILVLIIVAIAVIAPFFQNTANTSPANSVINAENVNYGGLNVSTNIALPAQTANVMTKIPSSQSVLEAIARTFTEKFGSFSTQGNNENLYDAEYYMTADMKEWAEKYIKESQNKKNAEFHGITTRALKAEIISLNDEETQAQIVVTAQREETRGSASGRKNIIYQKLVLDFLKVDKDWKVNAANWK